MAFIAYQPLDAIEERFRVDDDDNILGIHAIHPEVLRQHYDLYVQLMHRPGPLTRAQRELIAVVVSNHNQCHY